MKTERAARFKYIMGNLGQVRVEIRHQMEAEDVLSCFNINTMLLKQHVIAAVKLLATNDIYLT